MYSRHSLNGVSTYNTLITYCFFFCFIRLEGVSQLLLRLSNDLFNRRPLLLLIDQLFLDHSLHGPSIDGAVFLVVSFQVDNPLKLY